MSFSRRAATVALCGMVAGCADPLARQTTAELREEIIHAQRRQIRAVGEAAPVQVSPPAAELYGQGKTSAVDVQRLDETSGPAVYKEIPLDTGAGLDGTPSPAAAMSLEQATRIAARNNLDVAIAAIQPAISEAAIVQAEARFDAVLFFEGSWNKIDRPQAQRLIDSDGPGGNPEVPVGLGSQISDVADLRTGIRKPMDTGGILTVSTGSEYFNNKTPDFRSTPDPSWNNDVLVSLSQPLLRNFGQYVNRAEIYLTRNLSRRNVLNLHAQMLATLGDVEEVYWQLYLARQSLAIQQRLLNLTLDTRETILRRADFDASNIQAAQANAFVESRRQETIRARTQVRELSDQLKRLLHDPNLPIAEETLIVPLDEPIEMPLTFSLLDNVTQALRNRPEVRQALLEIDDASIRQVVADNLRLPLLNLNAQLGYLGLGGKWDEGYKDIGEGDFIEYLVGAQFEQPLGNRAAEAQMTQTRLARQQTVIGYKRVVQDVVLNVKNAMRTLAEAYETIAVARATRRAFAENLRVLEARAREQEGMTPEFLELRLNTQQRVADAEIRELAAVVTYNIALARLHEATGTLLEHNRIEFNWPDYMFVDDREIDRRGGVAENVDIEPVDVREAEERYLREVLETENPGAAPNVP